MITGLDPTATETSKTLRPRLLAQRGLDEDLRARAGPVEMSLKGRERYGIVATPLRMRHSARSGTGHRREVVRRVCAARSTRPQLARRPTVVGFEKGYRSVARPRRNPARGDRSASRWKHCSVDWPGARRVLLQPADRERRSPNHRPGADRAPAAGHPASGRNGRPRPCPSLTARGRPGSWPAPSP
jgi:hypothetical protein